MSIKFKNTCNELFKWSFVVLTFSLLFYKKLIPPIIILNVIFWVASGDYKEKFERLKENNFIFFLPIFYLIHLVGLIYTSNINSGFEDIGMKISLFIFPLIIFGSSIRKDIKTIRIILISFLLGCLISSIIVLLIAFSRSLSGVNPIEKETGFFYYQNLSYFLHVSYFATYLSFAIGICYSFIYSKFLKPIYWLLLILFFVIMIFLLASKGGIISFLGVSIFILIHLISKSKNKIISIAIVLVGAVILIYILKENPRFKSMKSIADDLIHPKIEDLSLSSNDSNAERSFLVKAGVEVIKENFLIGVGTGDVIDCEVAKYQEMKLTKLANQKLNSHNQYIEFMVQFGLIGGLYYLCILFFAGYVFFKQKNIIGVVFLISWMISCLFEAMFNQQAGIIYFCLFITLLMSIKDRNSITI